MEEIDLGEFMKFCKDFQIPLPKAKQQEIFKKSSASHKPLKIEQFHQALGRVATEMNKQRLFEVSQRLKQLAAGGGGGYPRSSMQDDDQFARYEGSPGDRNPGSSMLEGLPAEEDLDFESL